MSGGSGNRLWPLSTHKLPKQFINIDGETFFEKTLKRLDNKYFEKPIILTNKNYLNLLKKYKSRISKVIAEPLIRNTTSSIANVLEILSDNDIVVFLPSDSYIKDVEKFNQYLLEGENIVKSGKIACFGVKPKYPEAEYGYIEKGDLIKDNIFKIKQFKEKPDIITAASFLKSNNFLWNAGIFMGKISFLKELFKKYQPNIYKNITNSIKFATVKGDVIYPDENFYSQCENISIDYGIIEKLDSDRLNVISMDIDWNDIGTYKSLSTFFDNDKNNNQLLSKAILNNSANNFIFSKNNIVCCSDVSGLVVVEKDGIILITTKENSQNARLLKEKFENNE